MAQVIKTIDITPEWSGIVGGMMMVLEEGTELGKQEMRKEFKRMAQLLDTFNTVEWGTIIEAAETRRTQWQGIANGDSPPDVIDELYEVKDSDARKGTTEAQDIATLQQQAIGTLRKALGGKYS